MTFSSQLPEHLGGHPVELEMEGLKEDEAIVGWMDEYGTITNRKGEQIGDVITAKDNEVQAIVLRRGKVNW